MTSLSTPVCPKAIPKSPLGTSVLTSGSCFADHLTLHLRQHYYPVHGSPYGIVYHPLALAAQLERLLDNVPPTEAELGGEDLFFHDLFHGDFSHVDKAETLSRMQQAHAEGQAALQTAGIVVLTLGTSYGYVKQGRVVSNCHKQPASMFTRELFTAEQITQALSPLLARLDQKQVHLTVSPVRHLRDDPTDNQISKAHLLIACRELSGSLPHVHYFPAYEMMMDELRDYRFYAEDMVHPSPLAARLISERWITWALVEADYWREAADLYRREQHRLLRPQSPEARAFVAETAERKRSHWQKYPFAVEA